MKSFIMIAIAALGTLLVTAPGALAQSTNCTSTLTTVPSGNVIVPTGATCTLDGATVDGNVIVETDATLTVNGGSITGNVQGNSCVLVNLFGPGGLTITGNVVIQNCSMPSGASIQHGGPITIMGSFTCQNNNAPCTLIGATVGNNVIINNNNADSFFLTNIGGNTIAGNLVCQGNIPAVMNNNTKNVVAGHELGQCVNL
jgi:hypothetical protein